MSNYDTEKSHTTHPDWATWWIQNEYGNTFYSTTRPKWKEPGPDERVGFVTVTYTIPDGYGEAWSRQLTISPVGGKLASVIFLDGNNNPDDTREKLQAGVPHHEAPAVPEWARWIISFDSEDVLYSIDPPDICTEIVAFDKPVTKVVYRTPAAMRASLKRRGIPKVESIARIHSAGPIAEDTAATTLRAIDKAMADDPSRVKPLSATLLADMQELTDAAEKDAPTPMEELSPIERMRNLIKGGGPIAMRSDVRETAMDVLKQIDRQRLELETAVSDLTQELQEMTGALSAVKQEGEGFAQIVSMLKDAIAGAGLETYELPRYRDAPITAWGLRPKNNSAAAFELLNCGKTTLPVDLSVFAPYVADVRRHWIRECERWGLLGPAEAMAHAQARVSDCDRLLKLCGVPRGTDAIATAGMAAGGTP